MPPASPSSSFQNSVVYTTGVVQGIVLVTFPAASAIFTAKDAYALNATQYGVMFLPQVVAAIIAALAGGRLGAKFGTKRIYQAGLASSFLAMLLLYLSQFVQAREAIAYPMLLVATAFVGLGFGLTVPTLNTLAAAFHAKAVDRATLILNALLGVGTALAPVFVAIFVGLGFWWGLPLLSIGILVLLAVISAPLPLAVDVGKPGPTGRQARLPGKFWLLLAIALLYGIVETMSGNWAGTYVTANLGGSALQASLALTAFWASVTLGRVIIAVLQGRIPARWIYRIIPLITSVAFFALSIAAQGLAVLGILEFALAGLGCSALLPLTISFGEEESPDTPASGRLIAVYQVGYGIAAFAVGPLTSGGFNLSGVFAITGVGAVVIAALATLHTLRDRTAPKR